MTSFREYVEAGLALCEFDPGTKGPSGPKANGWNLRERAITDPQRINGMVQGGLLHAYSGTASIDVDNVAEARVFLAAHGVDLDALLSARDSVQISSGRRNRAKLIYRLATPLPSKKLCRYQSLVDGKYYHALELRCATRGGLSVQDVIPPSVHPDTGKPYTWVYGSELTGSWRNLPELPAALLALWQEGASEPHEDLIGTPVQAEAEADLAELRHYLDYQLSDAYDDWLAVGMALHDATGGSPEGLLLWDEWSRKFPRYGESKNGLPPQYPTDKWPSFTAGMKGGKTIGYLKSGAPPYVPLDSFPVTPEAEFKVDAKGPEDTRPGAIIRRALAPLIFISSQGTYYDTNDRGYLAMQSVDHLYTHKMPVMSLVSSSGAVKTYQPKPTEELRRAAWKEVAHGIALAPGGERFFTEDGRRFFNSWEPQDITPLKPTAHEREAFHAMWGRPDEKVFRDWLLQFFAHAVQKPQEKIGMAPLIVGHATGSGKNTLMEILPRILFGNRHFNTMTHATLKSDFSDKLADTWWLYFSELHSGSTKGERISIIKKIEPWITDKFIEVHPKGGKPYDIRNRVQPTASSNFEDDAIYVNGSDRRWAVGHIEKSLTDVEAADIYRFLESPRAPAVLHHIFREVSLTGFNPRGRAPETRAKRVMVNVNYGHLESELLEMISSGASPFNKDLVDTKDMLLYVKSTGVTAARLSRIVMRAPFNFVQMSGAAGKPVWAWRNAALWEAAGPGARGDHASGAAGRPPGYPWSDDLPASIAEACGL